MKKLISELTRLYLSAGSISPQLLEQRVLGQSTNDINLSTDDGLSRAMVIAFDKPANGSNSDDGAHWSSLCALANALQTELGFPAPAVSISGANGYGLWLSLEIPVPTAEAQAFLELLRNAYFPDMELRADAVSGPVELPPCLHPDTGKWAAFIHPGMGASFADESGLEMAPPFAGQAAFLEGLHRISEKQLLHALNLLSQSYGAALTTTAAASAAANASARLSPIAPASVRPEADGVLLADATLEDIVRLLHSRNIEPTFRHLIPAPAK
jgi:hypothetical protein